MQGVNRMRAARRAQSPISGSRLHRSATRKIGVFIHESSFVDDGAVIGRGTRIWHFCHVCAGAQIGDECSLGQNVFVGDRAILGRNVRVQNNVSIYDEVQIDDDVFCGPSMVFTNVTTPRSHVPRKHAFEKTVVRRGATIGANATILCGTELGRYCFVGAGSVVTRDVPAHALMIGVPARRVGWMCRCGARLLPRGTSLRCPECAARYRKQRGVLVER